MGNIIGKAVGGVVGGVLAKRSAKRQARRVEAAGREAAAQLQPFQQTGAQANALLANALGLGGDPTAAQRALQQFQASTGFQNQLQIAGQAITGNQAARGLLGSGSTARALQQSAQGLAQQSFGDFLNQLGFLSQQGAGAAGQAGQFLTGGAQQGAGIRAGGSAGLQSGLGQAFQSVPFGNIFGNRIPSFSQLRVTASPRRAPLTGG